MRLFRKPRPADGVLVESTDHAGFTAVLVRRRGQVRCLCPYACLATYEPCEFADLTGVERLAPIGPEPRYIDGRADATGEQP